jgi:hypothetical protein
MTKNFFIPPGLSVKEHAWWVKRYGPKPKPKRKPKVKAKPRRKAKPLPSNSGSIPKVKFLAPPKGWRPYKSPRNIAKQKALVAATVALNKAIAKAWANYRIRCDKIFALTPPALPAPPVGEHTHANDIQHRDQG